jgi:hypothetical protein
VVLATVAAADGPVAAAGALQGVHTTYGAFQAALRELYEYIHVRTQIITLDLVIHFARSFSLRYRLLLNHTLLHA